MSSNMIVNVLYYMFTGDRDKAPVRRPQDGEHKQTDSDGWNLVRHK